MVLKKLKISLFLLLLLFVDHAFPQYKDMDLRDFTYVAELIFKEKKNIFSSLSEIISEPEIKSEIMALRTFAQSGKKISNMYALNDRIMNDIKLIHQKAHLLGFYGAEIKYKIHALRKKVYAKINVDLGAPFKLKLDVKYIGFDEKISEQYETVLRKKIHTLKASIAEIKNLINMAIFDLRKDGFYEPEILEKRVRLDYEKKQAILHLKINPGQLVKFSAVKISAFPGISEEFIRNRIDWNEGDIFNIEKIENTVEDLKNSQIFSKVKIKPLESEKIDDKIPMQIILEEDKKHTVDLSLLYSTAKNMSFEKKSRTEKKLKYMIARLSWTRCNAFGGGEGLRFIVEGTPMRAGAKQANYSFEAAVTQPDVFFVDNSAEYSISRKQELTNAYFKRSDRISIMFDYPLCDSTSVRFGGFTEKNHIDGNEMFFKENDQHRKYRDFSIPIGIIIDKTNDLLNPTSGYRASAKFTRTQLGSASISGLNVLDVSFSYNYPLDEAHNNVMAFNISRKAILNGKIDDIPLDKRIYAGGIGSVRGYSNQMATEALTEEAIPMGGKSSIEFNIECRRKTSKDFGMALFFDGAKIFQNQSKIEELKIGKKRWFLSAGVGIRYFTSIGPIRVDFAFPIKRRRGIDSKMQFILSLGQAF